MTDEKPVAPGDWIRNDGVETFTYGEKVLIAKRSRDSKVKWVIALTTVEVTSNGGVWFVSGTLAWFTADVPWFIRLSNQ